MVGGVGALASLPSEVGAGLAQGSIGQSALFALSQGWLIKLWFDAPFLGKQKSNKRVEEQRTGLANSLVEKINNPLCFQKRYGTR